MLWCAPDVDKPAMPVNPSSGSLALEEIGFAACIVDRHLRYRHVNAAWEQFVQGDVFKYRALNIEINRPRILEDFPDDRRERWGSALDAIVGGRLGHFLDRTDETSSLGGRQVVTA